MSSKTQWAENIGRVVLTAIQSFSSRSTSSPSESSRLQTTPNFRFGKIHRWVIKFSACWPSCSLQSLLDMVTKVYRNLRPTFKNGKTFNLRNSMCEIVKGRFCTIFRIGLGLLQKLLCWRFSKTHFLICETINLFVGKVQTVYVFSLYFSRRIRSEVHRRLCWILKMWVYSCWNFQSPSKRPVARHFWPHLTPDRKWPGLFVPLYCALTLVLPLSGIINLHIS